MLSDAVLDFKLFILFYSIKRFNYKILICLILNTSCINSISITKLFSHGPDGYTTSVKVCFPHSYAVF